MILTVNTKKLFESIISPSHREKFVKLCEGKDFTWGMEIKIYDQKTDKQNSAAWVDYTIVGILLFTEKEQIYDICQQSPYLKEFFDIEEPIGFPNGMKTRTRKRGLSEFDKDEMCALIEKQRDFMQSLVDRVYQQNVIIRWACEENRHKPSFEFTDSVSPDLKKQLEEIMK